MRIGFIGAGKVGFSLGKYLCEHQIAVTGYYSRSSDSAREAAEFTQTKYYETMETLVRDSDIVFLTVSDTAIIQVWNQLKKLPMAEKIICHCSGVLSSEVFSDIADKKSYGYSIHPLLAVSDKRQSYQEFSSAVITIEGSAEKKEAMMEMFRSCGNRVIPIAADEKIRYHASAVLASNLVLGLLEVSVEELVHCGFSQEEAVKALFPLIFGNISHLKEQTIEQSLTGPVERCDASTVEKHLATLEGENREIYRLLSQKALSIAKRKNPQREYQEMEEILNG